jgi:alginate O-acetyltransferase complex protein AlgI
MLFNSFLFLVFFVVVVTLYYAVPQKWKWLLLLVASCYFYAVFIPVYLLILFAIILIDFFAGIYIEKSSGRRRKFFLAISIVANISVLSVFKYHNFIIENINTLLGLLGAEKHFPIWQIILPIGLSFHTFQAMSYTIEVYRGNQKAEKHPGIYALYVMFFPQLVAGPIERPQKLIPQFYRQHKIDYALIGSGLKIMLIGFFMKVVVADRLGIYVNYIYVNPLAHGRLALLTAIIFYAFQIYGDFAGYSLIAIGAAKTLGIDLSLNFNQPYLSASVTEFWRRWHITLSNWFRDYVYIPLGGSRVSTFRFCINILFVFALSGFWHGATWSYVAWGVSHGVLIIIETFTGMNKQRKNPVARFFSIVYTFIILSFSLVFVRSKSIAVAFSVFKRVFDPKTPTRVPAEFDERALLSYSAIAIFCMILLDIKNEFYTEKKLLLSNQHVSVRIAGCIIIICAILMFGVFDASQFIYFQF